MTTENALAALIADLKARKPGHFQGQTDPPISEERISVVERVHGVRLPDAFRHHLLTEGAGDFAFGWIYSPDPDSGWSLWKEYEFAPTLKGRYLPFSDNGCGDYYCFPILNAVCEDHIVWADHEQDYSITPADCADFRDFIVTVCLNPA